MDPKKPTSQDYVIRYTLKPSEIQDFVNALHNTQADMLEQLVEREESRGFPQVQQILQRFQ